jgi:hypothetical protein
VDEVLKIWRGGCPVSAIFFHVPIDKTKGRIDLRSRADYVFCAMLNSAALNVRIAASGNMAAVVTDYVTRIHWHSFISALEG